MGRAATAQVELHHTLCLCQGGEPLGAPLASVVGGLVADLDFHGSFAVDCLSIGGQWAAGRRHCDTLPGVTITCPPWAMQRASTLTLAALMPWDSPSPKSTTAPSARARQERS